MTDTTLTRLTIATVAAVYAQILVGATMRHIGAGLAIPDFPLAFGRLVPAEWTVPIAVHFAHRVGAVIVTVAVVATAGHVLAHHRGRRQLANPAWWLLGLVTVQFTLGALTVLSERHVGINTAHLATGAALLATALVLALRTHRPRFSNDPTGAPMTAATAVSASPSPEAIR